MKHSIFSALALLASFSTLAQSGSEEIEALLAGTAGRERLEVLAELTTANRDENAARAVEWGEEALDLLRSHPDRARQLEVLSSLSYAHIILGDYPAALDLGSQARDLASAAGDKAAQAFALRNIGRAYRSSSEYDRALAAYRRATELYAEIGETPGLGDALNDTGIVHWMQGDYTQALEYFIRARRKYEESGDRQRIAAILNNTGMIYRRLGQHDTALELYHKALEIRRQIGPKGALSNVLNNIGNVHRDQGEPARALELYLESLEVGPRDPLNHANTLNNVGAAYQDLGDLDRAMRYYERATDTRRTIGDEHGVAHSLLRYGSIQRQRGELSSALESLHQALAITEKLDAKDEIKEAHLQLSETYVAMGRHRDALAAFQQYERVKSEIFDAWSNSTIAEMQARFESDRKEKAIELLQHQQEIAALELGRQAAARRALYGGLALLSLVIGLLYNRYRLRARASRQTERQNRELEQAMIELKASERERRQLQREQIRREERERYIAELEAKNDEVEARNAEMERFTYTLSHDLRSPLVTIRGFLGLLRKDTLAGNLERMERDVDRIDAAVNRMGQLLDELLEMVSIGRITGDSEDVPFGELAQEAVAQVVEDYPGRQVEIDVAPGLPVVHGERQRLVEILRNLIGNAVQFTAEQPEPRIEVGCRQPGDETIFYVRDNGIGIDSQYLEKIFGLFERLSARTEGTGVGLALVKRIIEVHGGQVWAESAGLGHGSTFCFTLPRDREAEQAHRRRVPSLRATDYGKLFQHAHDAILILDPAEERILDANHRACELYGFTRSELIGRSMLELTPTHGRAADHVAPTLEARGRYTFETVQKRKDSSEIRLEVHAAAVEFRGRRAILSINRDVTRRRRQEEALARQRAQLEETIQNRTARLDEALRVLESKDAELAGFARAVADLRGPLATLDEQLDLVAQGPVAEHDHRIEQVLGAASQLRRLVDRLLELTWDGSAVDRPAAVSLGELVDKPAN